MKNIPIRTIITAQNELNTSHHFSIRDLGELLKGKDMVQALHRHDFFYILALKKGRGVHEIDFTRYNVCDYCIFFMRPGQVHQLTLNAGSAGYLMEFRIDFYSLQEKISSMQFRKVSSVDFYNLNRTKFKTIFSTLSNIAQEFLSKKEGYNDVIKAYLDILFIELARNTEKTAIHNVGRYTQEKLNRFLELLETHISTDKQSSQYAEMMNLSRYQLNAILKEALGKSSSELIKDHIILESKRYLLATSNQINQIADHLGYEDVSYFIRFFKKHTGYSPEAFRNNFK